ncbi:MAG: twin-arginine translocation signal domain-containing protein, partial [Planctomycetota bacterium]
MHENREETTRRNFLKDSTTSAAAVALGLNLAGAPAIRRVRGANERIRVGFIGIGNRGTQLLTRFMKQDDVEVAALCDVYEPYLMRDYSKVDKRLRDALGGRVPRMTEDLRDNVPRYNDFR